MKPDFTLPKEITDKLKIGRWYKVWGSYDGETMKWSYQEEKENK